MISKAVEYLVIAIVLFLTGWWFYDEIGDHFRAPLIAKHKAALKEAQDLTAKREGENKQRATNASSQKIKRLEAALLASNAAASSAVGLRNNLRASAAFRDNSAACLQYADTVNDILRAGTELAGRIAKEADGHVADKIACTDSYPK